MNLQRIERLKGLLARIELNVNKPRVLGFADVMVAPAEQPLEPDDHVSVVSTRVVAPVVAKTVEPVVAPVVAKAVEPELEDLEFGEPAVELPPVEPEVVAAKLSEPALESEIEDVSAEDISFEELAPPPPEASAPLRTDVQAAPMPFTAPPSLDELTFSEPPPPLESEAPPVSSRRASSGPPDSIDAALLAASEAQAAFEEPDALVLTPPPESGPMPARAVEIPKHAAPTMEQLGDVVELDEATGPALELAEPAPVLAPQEPEELEFVPSTATPPAAREAMPTLLEIEPHLPTEPPPAPIEEFEEEVPTSVTAAQLNAQIIARRFVTPTRPVIDVISHAQAFAPASFLELLDASMKLGKR